MTNTKEETKADRELRAAIRQQLKERIQLRDASLRAYTSGIMRFCDYHKIQPEDFKTLGLEKIEDMTERYIFANIKTLAPKTLNMIFNSVKAYCFALGLIRNRNMFKEIKFDKTSRKVDAMQERPLETEHVKELFIIADLHEKAMLGLYGLCGLRPALIPQLKVSDFLYTDYELKEGKIHFTAKNPFLIVPKEYEGNKAHVTFFVIVPSKLTEILERSINNNGTITEKTHLMKRYMTVSGIGNKVRALYAQIGFNGRPYLLRGYTDRILDRNLRDTDLKERLMGHKGDISATYQFKQLSKEDARVYRQLYEPVDNYINEHIFGIRTTEEISQAKAVMRFAKGIGVDDDQLKAIFEAFNSGKLELTDFENQVSKLTTNTLSKQMEAKFNEMFQRAARDNGLISGEK